MAIKIGNLDINSFKAGSDDCKIYLGDTLLYPTTQPSFKFKAEYSGGVSYSAACDGNTELTTATTKPSGYQYTAMTEAIIGDCVTSIGDLAFDGCSSLTSITIPNSITTIGSGGLSFTGLIDVVLPDSVTSIGDTAFYNCTSLTSVTVNATTPPTLISTDVFDNTNNCPIYVPCESVNAYKSATNWSAYESRIQCVEPSFDGKWKATYSDSSILSAECGSSSEITQYEISGTNLVSVEVGDCVTSIGFEAFCECSSLTSVSIGNGVTSIGDGAFRYCFSLSSITIPDSVTSIGMEAFFLCDKLTAITVNSIVPPTLGTDAFDETNECPILVPSQSLEAYRNAWSQYSSRIQPIPNS